MRWPLMKNTLSFKDKLKLSLFILRNSRLTQGSKVKEFEKAWSDWLGCSYSVFVTSGSTANFLLLDTIIEYHNIPKGAKVLVPASTWTTTVSPVVQLGLTPIFCDVDTKNFGMCVKDMEKIAEEHPDISVIFVAHLLGLSSPVEEYRRIFPNALVLEDICESHGVRSPEG